MSNRLTVYNLSVTFETNDFTLQGHIETFLARFYTVKLRPISGQGETTIRVYAGKVKNYAAWQFHSNQFIHFYHYLKDIGYTLKIDEKIDMRDYISVNTNFKVRDGWAPREEQQSIIDFLLDNPTKSKLVPLRTGGGKTYVAMEAIGRLKKRLAIVVLARFIDKWAPDIMKIHEAELSDILIIKGSNHLKGLIGLAQEKKLKQNYIIFSAETLQSYLSRYEADPVECVDEYGCSPLELFPLLGVGIMLNDESHMSFHLLYRTVIYTNVEYQIGLTATLITDDSVIKRMHKVIYPTNCVYGDSHIKAYMDMYPISYPMHERLRRLVKTTNFNSNTYSHTAFENSILRYKFILDSYCKLIKTTVDDYYIEDYMEKDKVAIFVSTVKMADELIHRLKVWYPDKQIVRYCQDDDYDEMLEGEIIVSTPGSLGTGIDVPNLRVVIQTVCVSSTPVNLQVAGRLRELKDRDVKFCYLYCEHLGKQRDYHNKRLEIFATRARNVLLRKSRSMLA